VDDLRMHALAFDRLGGAWRRIEPVTGVHEAKCAWLLRTFRRELNDTPAVFAHSLEFEGAPPLLVEWHSIFPSVGMSRMSFEGKLCVVTLYLSGQHERSEDASIDSIQGMIAASPGSTFAPAFATIRQRTQRPLVVTFRVADVQGEEKVSAVLCCEKTLAKAFFGRPIALETLPASAPLSA
jgi:hypothetical protein